MKRILMVLIFFSIWSFTSCAVIEAILDDDDECTSNCDYDSEPDEGRVDITVTINSLNPEVIIEIFHGDVEDNDLMESRIMTEEKLRLTLPNGEYSVRANYKAILEGETVTVYSVDGDCLDADAYGECGDICYEEGSIDLDVTLVPLKKYVTEIYLPSSQP